MKTPKRVTAVLAWLFFICAFGFLIYLYPLPSASIERSLSSLPAGTDVNVRDYIESSIWLAWITNLALGVSGIFSALLWISGANSTGRKWTAVVFALIFVTICGVIIWVQAGKVESWTEQRIAFLTQLISAGVWSYVAAEVHRLIASLVSIVALIAMLISMPDRPRST